MQFRGRPHAHPFLRRSHGAGLPRRAGGDQQRPAHGKASVIGLLLSADAREITPTISDNGLGLAQQAQPVSGIGLRIMSHRLTSLGGAFEMEAGTPRGTVVRCRFPLAAAVA